MNNDRQSLAAAIQEAAELVQRLTKEVQDANFVLNHSDERTIALVANGLLPASRAAELTRKLLEKS